MKPILYDAKGEPTHYASGDGADRKIWHAPTQAQQEFAPWNGGPLTIIQPPPPIPEFEGFIEVPDPPEVVLAKSVMDDKQLRRAQAMKRLGGGPLYKAQKQAEQRVGDEQSKAIKYLIDGIHRRDVL